MQNQHQHSDKHYQNLVLMIVLSFISMYVLMYAMVDKFANVIPNINQVYMAGLMTCPMIIIELLLMRKMYMNKKLNTIILVVSSISLISFYALIRLQSGVSDKQFLRSMIPHHAGAILMVEETELKDPEIQKLASDIISSQQKEIEFMKAKLKELEK